MVNSDEQPSVDPIRRAPVSTTTRTCYRRDIDNPASTTKPLILVSIYATPYLLGNDYHFVVEFKPFLGYIEVADSRKRSVCNFAQRSFNNGGLEERGAKTFNAKTKYLST